MYSSRTWITEIYSQMLNCFNLKINLCMRSFTVNYYNYLSLVNVVILLLMRIVFAICFVFSDFHHVHDFYQGINGLVSLFYFYIKNILKFPQNSHKHFNIIKTYFEALLMSGLKLSRLA
jgi:hypothetical protein